MTPVWVDEQVVLAIHEQQLAEHGGLPGVNLGPLQSALGRPRNLSAYEQPDILRLSTAYAFGLAKGHAFVDGNKRTSLVVAELFLNLNGYRLQASDEQCLRVWLGIARGDLSEAEFIAWLNQQLTADVMGARPGAHRTE